MAQSGILKDCCRRRVDREDSHKQSLESDILVTLFLSYVKSFLQDIIRGSAQVGLAARHARFQGDLFINLPHKCGGVGSYLGKYEVDERLSLSHNPLEKMYGFDSLITCSTGNLYRLLYCFLRLNCEIIEVH